MEISPVLPQITLPTPLLLKLMEDSEYEVRALASHAVGQAALQKPLKPEIAVPLLIQALKGPNLRCRKEAAIALNKFDAPANEVIPILENYLKSFDAETRYWAMRALSAYGQQAQSSVALLLQCAAVRDPNERVAIFRTIEKIDPKIAQANLKLLDIDYYQDPRVVTKLISNLSDPNRDPFTRRLAAYRLGNFGEAGKPAIPALLMALGDTNDSVRATVGEALKKIDPEAAQKAGGK